MVTVENVKAFLAALTLAVNVTKRHKGTIKALSAVHIQAESGTLITTATDLETWQMSKVPAIGTLDVAVNGKALLTVLKKLGKGEITLAKGETKLEIRCGTRKLGLDLFPVEDLPVLPTPTTLGIKLDKAKFYQALSFVASTVSADTTRLHLAAVHVEGEKTKLTLVTTDGHRLSKVEIQGCDGAFDATVDVPSSVATSMLDSMKAANGTAPTVGFGHGDGYVSLVCGPHYVMGKLQGEEEDRFRRFPPYDKVIPRSYDVEIKVDAADLRGAADLSKAIKSGMNNGTRFDFTPEGFTVSAEGDDDMGEVSEEIRGVYTRRDGRLESIGFNAAYILDALKDRTGEVTLRFCEDLDPIQITGGTDNETMYSLIMPLRL